MATRFPPLLRGWRAALLLAAVACASPGRASAECGDHVLILNGPAAQAAQSPAGQPADAAPPAPRPPCRGPGCSGVPTPKTPPIVPVTSSTTQLKEQAGTTGVGHEADAGTGSSLARDTQSPRPIRRPTSVFHPPRLG